MSAYLLDTNVISELVRKRPEPQVIETLQRVHPKDLATCSICVTELRFGTVRHPRGNSLWLRLKKEILGSLDVLPIGEPEAERAGELLADLAKRGEPIGIEDVLVAATAQVSHRIVVTRNIKHFSRIQGLQYESWWP